MYKSQIALGILLMVVTAALFIISFLPPHPVGYNAGHTFGKMFGSAIIPAALFVVGVKVTFDGLRKMVEASVIAPKSVSQNKSE